jgi:hypothetical protein
MSFLINKHQLIAYGIQLLALGISVLALALSLYNLYKIKKTEASTKRVGDRSKSAKHSAQQSIEMTLNALISLNRAKMEEAEHLLKDFTDRNPDKVDEFRKKILMNSIEEYLKTFDNACLLYLEDRYEKEKFIKEFRQEIRNIVEKEHFFVKLFDNPENIKNKYRAIQRVYDKWESIEK